MKQEKGKVGELTVQGFMCFHFSYSLPRLFTVVFLLQYLV